MHIDTTLEKTNFPSDVVSDLVLSPLVLSCLVFVYLCWFGYVGFEDGKFCGDGEGVGVCLKNKTQTNKQTNKKQNKNKTKNCVLLHKNVIINLDLKLCIL